MANGPKSGVETFSDSMAEEYKISELPEKFGIHVSKEEIKDYGEAFLNIKEIQSIKEGTKTVTQLGLEKLKLSIDNTSSAIHSYKEEIKPAELAEKVGENLEESFDATFEAASDFSKKVGNSELVQKAKETAEKAVEAGGFVAFVERMRKSDNFFLKFIGGLLGFFTDLLDFGKKIEDVKDGVEKALSSDEVEKTKDALLKVSDNFVETADSNLKELGVSLTQENKKELENFITNPDNFSEEEMQKLFKAFNNGEINNLSDIPKYLNGGTQSETYKKINLIIYDEGQREIIKNAGVHKVQQSIENEFGIIIGELEAEKKQALNQLIRKNGINEDFIQISEKYNNNEFIAFSELIKSGLIAVPHMALFTFELMTIIPIDGIAKYFMLSVTNLFELSRENGGDMQETILAKIENSSPEQKNMLFGIAMRKGMFAMNIIDKLAFVLTRTIVESIDHGHGNFLNNAKVFGGSNFGEQKTLFEKFMKTLGKNGNIQTEYIKYRMSSLNQATQKSSNIAEIMQEIKGSNSKIKKIKIKLQNLTNNKIAQNLLNKNFSTIGELNIFLGNEISGIKGNLGKIQGTGYKGGAKDIFNKGGLGIDSELNNLLKAQESRLNVFLKEWERYLGQNGGNIKFWRKFNAIGESLRFSHDMKNVEIHVDSLSKGATHLEHLKAMQIESPKLFGSLFGTIASGFILNAGIETKEDNTSILKHIYEVGKYIIPTVGPLQVILNESGVQKSDTLRNSIKFGSETAAMGILLTMDAAFISQTLITKGLVRNGGEGFFKILKYHGQIVTSPYDFLKASNFERAKFIEYQKAGEKGLFNYLKNSPKISPKLIKQMFKSKNLWLGATAVGLLGINYFTESSETKKINELKEKGLLDKDNNPISENIANNMNIEDKKFILEYLIWGNIQDINVTFDGEKTIVKTTDENVNKINLLYPNGLSIINALDEIGINTDGDFLIIEKI